MPFLFPPINFIINAEFGSSGGIFKLFMKMKKVFYSVAVALVGVTMLSSCMGAAFVDATGPVAATSNPVGKKVGHASSTNVLGIVHTGDGGIDKAAKEAGIKKISHVDQNQFSILGLFTTYKTTVYGE